MNLRIKFRFSILPIKKASLKTEQASRFQRLAGNYWMFAQPVLLGVKCFIFQFFSFFALLKASLRA